MASRRRVLGRLCGKRNWLKVESGSDNIARCPTIRFLQRPETEKQSLSYRSYDMLIIATSCLRQLLEVYFNWTTHIRLRELNALFNIALLSPTIPFER